MQIASKLLKELDNKNIDVKILSHLDHYLRKVTDEAMQNKDYSTIYKIDEGATTTIINWLKNRITTNYKQ